MASLVRTDELIEQIIPVGNETDPCRATIRPDVSFPHGDARLDLTDLYAFPKPGNAGKTILIMNVHRSSSIDPPESTDHDPFAVDLARTSMRGFDSKSCQSCQMQA